MQIRKSRKNREFVSNCKNRCEKLVSSRRNRSRNWSDYNKIVKIYWREILINLLLPLSKRWSQIVMWTQARLKPRLPLSHQSDPCTTRNRERNLRWKKIMTCMIWSTKKKRILMNKIIEFRLYLKINKNNKKDLKAKFLLKLTRKKSTQNHP